jgi:putative pyruvate formate lyase activating enzyme
MNLFENWNECLMCPRKCRVNRTNTKSANGYCACGDKLTIASICIHKGEEPVISGATGICNVFFAHCNLQCVYCQNYQISNNSIPAESWEMDWEVAMQTIIGFLNAGCHALGFVSPSHCIPQMLKMINELHLRNKKPIIVYNSNGYDEVDSLKLLEGIVDIYLPDYKYAQANLASSLSGAKNYPEKVLSALQEMYRQKGSSLICDEENNAISGLIIRHLILPGFIENSMDVLHSIAENISASVAISLMAQYFPVKKNIEVPSLNRTLTLDEYNRVKNEMELLGFYKGWVQELKSNANYLPDFNFVNPFEK